MDILARGGLCDGRSAQRWHGLIVWRASQCKGSNRYCMYDIGDHGNSQI